MKNGISNQMSVAIYSFHMPLFFLISGMLLKRRKDDTIGHLGKTVKRRLLSYSLPYLVWGLFYTTFTLKHILELCYGTRETLALAGSLSSLWFFPVLLFASLLTETVFFLLRKTDRFDVILFVIMAVVFSLGFLMPQTEPYGWPFAVNIGLVAAGFMMLGYFTRKWTDYVKMKRSRAILCLCVIAFLLCAVTYGVLPFQYVAMHKGSYGNVPVFLINAVIESYAVIIVSVLLDLTGFPLNRGIVYIGQSTVGILVLHKPIVTWLAERGISDTPSMTTVPVIFAIAIFTLAISLLISVFIRKLLPEILGQFPKEKDS